MKPQQIQWEFPYAIGATRVRLTIGNHSEDCAPENVPARVESLFSLHRNIPAFRYFAPASPGVVAPVPVSLAASPADAAPVAVQAPPAPVSSVSAVSVGGDDNPPSEPSQAPTGAALGYSQFGAGNRILDAAAWSWTEYQSTIGLKRPA